MRSFSCLGLLLGLVAAEYQDGVAQGPYPRARPGQFEVQGLDFRPEGAWRKRTAVIRDSRRHMLRAGSLAQLNARVAPFASSSRVAGVLTVPVIPIAFRNAPPPFTAAQYQDALFNPYPTSHPYSVRTFYAQLSNGSLTLDGVVLDWVTADSTDLYYEDGCNGVGVTRPCPHFGQRFAELLREALQKNDTGRLDWGQFDNDGADGLPNSGDDDGIVDFVNFIQPEVDGACGTPHIWAHRFFIRGWSGSPYVTRTPWTGHPGQFIKVDDYTMQSGQGGDNACTAGQIMPIGTIAHETGHAFGLPDLYDTNLNSPNVNEGIGEWGLMGSGNYSAPNSPSRMEAWSLAELGWVAVDTLTASGTARLGPVATSDTVLYIGIPNTDEYFLLENRQAQESDTAQMNPAFRHPKMPGLLIWHIDQGQVSAHGFRQGNTVNSGPIHGVALVQADGLNQLDVPRLKNRGDPGDPFPGSTGNHEFSATSTPAALDNQGATAGLILDSIYQAATNGDVVFRYTKTTAGVVNVAVDQAADEILGTPTLGSAQKAYLDSLGNKNGVYDLGDFVAYLKSTGQAASPALMQRMLERSVPGPGAGRRTEVPSSREP